MAGKALPYDAEVEWLQGDGNAYIDLGFNLIAGRDDVYIKLNITPFGCSFFGARTSGTVKAFAAHHNINRGNETVELVNNGDATRQWESCYLISNETYDVHFNNSYQKINQGESVVQDFVRARKDNFETDYTAYLFWAHGVTLGNTEKSKDKIFRCKIVRDLSIFIDLIPVRFTNSLGVSEGAMYNLLGVGGMNPDGSLRTDGLYRNRGTGAFGWKELDGTIVIP